MVDHRLQMGGVATASIAHQLGMLIAVLLLEDLDRALVELVAGDPVRWAGLTAWRKARRAASGGEAGADRPYDLRNFQGDFTPLLESGLGAWADGVIRASLSRWGVDLSGKELPLASSFESIGGRFTYDPVGRVLQVAPRDETRKKHREVCAALRRHLLAGFAGGAAEGEGASPEGPAEGACHALAEALRAGGVTVDGELGREEEVAAELEGAPERKRRRGHAEEDAGGSASSGRLYHSTMEQAVGMLEWCARFVDGGGLLCYEPQRFMWWLRGRNQGRTRFAPQEVMDAFDRVQRALDDGRTRPSLADPEAGHPGDGIAGDASTSTGWGLVVGKWVFSGAGPQKRSPPVRRRAVGGPRRGQARSRRRSMRSRMWNARERVPSVRCQSFPWSSWCKPSWCAPYG